MATPQDLPRRAQRRGGRAWLRQVPYRGGPEMRRNLIRRFKYPQCLEIIDHSFDAIFNLRHIEVNQVAKRFAGELKMVKKFS